MTPNQPAGMPNPDSLAELLARYLQNQLSDQTAGFAPFDAAGEVIPHEVGPTQPIDPRLAWEGAVAVFGCFRRDVRAKDLEKPADWPALTALHEPAAGLAFAAGNFPQLVRSLQPLLQARDLSPLRPGKATPLHAPAPQEWATPSVREKPYPQPLLALGVLRLARQFEEASRLLSDLKATAPAAWQDALANEEAALAWHAGRAEEAAALWNAQPESVPVLFNRGMAALFSGQSAAARTALTKAVKELPEDSAWHHLGRLYLALAETRS